MLNPEHFFLFLDWPLCSLKLYLFWSAAHAVCDSLFSQTPVAFGQGVMHYDPSVHVYKSTRICSKASLERSLNLFVSVHGHIFSASINLCVFFTQSHDDLKSAVICSKHRTASSHVISSQGDIRNEKITHIVSLLPFISCWIPEDRLKALHKSSLSYCCERWADETLGMKVQSSGSGEITWQQCSCYGKACSTHPSCSCCPSQPLENSADCLQLQKTKKRNLLPWFLVAKGTMFYTDCMFSHAAKSHRQAEITAIHNLLLHSDSKTTGPLFMD